MNPRPLISIIIPSYNNAIYLQKALDSLLVQSLQDFEIIVVNDGSIDDTRTILKKYSNKIIIIDQENKGKSYARNVGIDLSKGKYIAFMDADDISNRNRLKYQANYLTNHPDIGIVGSDVVLIDKHERPIARLTMPTSDLAIRWHSLTMLSCYNLMIRKDLLERYSFRYPVNIPYAEDYSFFVDLLQYTKISSIAKPLLSYRFHGNNETLNRGLESKISYHYPIVKKAILQELGLDNIPDLLIKKLSVLTLKGVREYPYPKSDLSKIANLYLDLWVSFSTKNKGNIEINELQKMICLRALVIGLFSQFSSEWSFLAKRIINMEKYLLFDFLKYTPQFTKKMLNNYKIKKFEKKLKRTV